MSAIHTDAPVYGPGWAEILPTMTAFRRRPMQFLIDLHAKYGSFARFQLGPIRCYLVTEPEAVASVFQNTDVFHKDNLTRYVVEPLFGDGLSLADGSEHRRKRKLVAPALYASRIKTYSHVMSQYVSEMVDSWEDGGTFLLEDELSTLMLKIVTRTMFDTQIVDMGEILTTIKNIVLQVGKKIREPIPVPYIFPTKGNRVMMDGVHLLERHMDRIIAEYREHGGSSDNILSMLMSACDEEGQPLTDAQIRSEMMEMLIAGHETSAHLLTWLFYELDRQPEVVAKLEAEIDAVLGDKPAAYEDIRRLTYTEMVLKEALRMYPTLWLTSRQPIEDVRLLGHDIPKGSIIFLSPFISHRQADQFDDPLKFDPERFAGRPERGWPAGRYVPFGGGAHVCLGSEFSITESTIALTAIIRKARLHRTEQKEIHFVAGATLRPDDPIPVRIEFR